MDFDQSMRRILDFDKIENALRETVAIADLLMNAADGDLRDDTLSSIASQLEQKILAVTDLFAELAKKYAMDVREITSAVREAAAIADLFMIAADGDLREGTVASIASQLEDKIVAVAALSAELAEKSAAPA